MTQQSPRREHPAPRLGALEQSVMDVLWDEAPLTIRQIIERLESGSAYTTIATVLGNLERKTLVRHDRVGRSALYAPVVSREKHAAQLMEQALSTSGDRAASILHFVEGIDASDLRLLRDYLARDQGDENGRTR